MAQKNEYENICELVNPLLPYIRGVCALIHDADPSDKGASYLLQVNAQLGAGNIIFGQFVQRHDHSRNRILYETGLKEGDFYIQTDLLERPKPEFLDKVPEIIKNNPHLGILYFYGKPFLVKFNESLFYRGNPHEGLIGSNGVLVEYSDYEQNEKIVRENIRSIKRLDKFGWVKHSAKYYLYPNSNQCLLHAERRGNKNEIFAKREEIRIKFIHFLNSQGYEKNVDGMIKALTEKSNDPFVKDFINKEKIIQDVYRFYVLKDYTIIDEHNWDSMKFFN